MFSTSPPEPTLLDYDQWSEVGSVDVELSWSPVEVEAPSWNFRYQFRLEDPAGISSYELKRGSRTVAADDDVGGYTTVVRVETLDSLSEGAFTALRGSQTTLESTDVYGNGGSERIHGQSSLYGDVIGTNVDPYGGGVLSGFTHSAAELPELVVTIARALWDDPQAAVDDFVDLLAQIDQETLTQAVPMIIETTQETQRLDNPHPKGSDEYEAYAQGWYEGYLLHFLASTAYGGSITKGVTKGANVGSRLSRVSDDLPAASRAIRADGSGLKSARIANQLANEGYDGLARQFRTAGKGAAAVKRLKQIDAHHLDSLSGSEQAVLSTRLSNAANPDATIRFVNELDETADVRKLLDEDVATMNRITDLYVNRKSARYIDSDLQPRHLVQVIKNRGDVTQTTSIVKTDQGVKWLEPGSSNAGYRHILERHQGDFYSSPSLGVSSPEGIKDVVYRTIKHGEAYRIPEADGGGYAYVRKINGQDVTVITGGNGFTVTAYPGQPKNVDI